MAGFHRLRSINEKEDGYKFAIAFSASIISIIYTLSNYFKDMAMSSYFYFMLCSTISLGILTLIGFFLYFIFKGFSMEVEDIKHKVFLIKIGSFFYRGSIYFFIFMLSVIILFLFEFYGKEYINYMILIICIILSVFVCFFYSPLFRKLNAPKNKHNFLLYFALIIIVFWFFLNAVIVPLTVTVNILSITSLRGNVVIDMQSVYQKSNLEIPVLIRITGQDTGLNISLFKEVAGNLSEITNISLGMSSIDENIKINNYIIANGLGNGKYNIFINTTNLDPGYYELRGERETYISKTSDAKGFFLLNR